MSTHTRAITVSFLCLLTPACSTMKETLTGGLAGAVIGAGVAAAMGEDRDAILVAAGIGATAGAFLGNQVALAKEGRRAEEDEKRRAAERAVSLQREEAARVEAARRFEEARLAKAQLDVEKRRQEELDRMAKETQAGNVPVPVAPIPDAIPQPVAIIVEIPETAETGTRLGVICDAETGQPLSDNVIVLPDEVDSDVNEDEPFVLTIPGATTEETRNYTAIYAG